MYGINLEIGILEYVSSTNTSTLQNHVFGVLPIGRRLQSIHISVELAFKNVFNGER